MAYIKYKELTKYFNFKEEIDVEDLPSYTKDYVSNKETVISGYKTFRDRAIFTNKSIILFDVSYLFGTRKTVHIIPYMSISTGSIIYKGSSASIFLTFDSGYQIKLNFVRLTGREKTRLRLLYTSIINTIK